jgi:hypothetical protein
VERIADASGDARAPVGSARRSSSGCRLLADTVEKGICRNLEATLIQDWKPMRNLDSKIYVAGFVRFKL